MSGKVPAGKTVHNGTTKTHLLSRLRGGMEGVVIAVESASSAQSSRSEIGELTYTVKQIPWWSDG